MSVHLLKPALRASDVYDFAQRQLQWYSEHNGQSVFPVWTSRKPVRADEMLDGGSVYWIVRNQIACRQAILDIIDYQGAADEKPSYLIICDPQLIRVQPVARRAFQGWRYLEADQAPMDMGAIVLDDQPPPPELAKILHEAGLL